MAKKERKLKDKSKGIIAEFKKFITRGNVVDLAVGVIIGGAFSAIVTALTSKIIMPVINVIISACTGGAGIDIITPLTPGLPRFLEDGTPNPNFIYIDWGAFIQAVINFLLIAIVLFIIIKVINAIADKKKALEDAAREKYYEKHPEERPVPGEKPKTELDVLVEIKEILQAKDVDKDSK